MEIGGEVGNIGRCDGDTVIGMIISLALCGFRESCLCGRRRGYCRREIKDDGGFID